MKGLIAPVFTCFKNDGSLTVEYVDKYGRWLKKHNVEGVIINGITGEGPILTVEERKRNVEAWSVVALKYELELIVQIGGAPLPDVLDMAQHAEALCVDSIICLPELFYKPETIEDLVCYCNIVAQNCKSRPFFYYHIPIVTNVNLDMAQFCVMAEARIPSFTGLHYVSTDLDMAARCLHPGRQILIGLPSLFTSGMLMGFEALSSVATTILPTECYNIYQAMLNKDLFSAQIYQDKLNELVWSKSSTMTSGFVVIMKQWFNDISKAGFSAGPARRLYI